MFHYVLKLSNKFKSEIKLLWNNEKRINFVKHLTTFLDENEKLIELRKTITCVVKLGVSTKVYFSIHFMSHMRHLLTVISSKINVPTIDAFFIDSSYQLCHNQFKAGVQL